MEKEVIEKIKRYFATYDDERDNDIVDILESLNKRVDKMSEYIEYLDKKIRDLEKKFKKQIEDEKLDIDSVHGW